MICCRVSQLTDEPTPTGFGDNDNCFGVGLHDLLLGMIIEIVGAGFAINDDDNNKMKSTCPPSIDKYVLGVGVGLYGLLLGIIIEIVGAGFAINDDNDN